MKTLGPEGVVGRLGDPGWHFHLGGGSPVDLGWSLHPRRLLIPCTPSPKPVAPLPGPQLSLTLEGHVDLLHRAPSDLGLASAVVP